MISKQGTWIEIPLEIFSQDVCQTGWAEDAGLGKETCYMIQFFTVFFSLWLSVTKLNMLID